MSQQLLDLRHKLNIAESRLNVRINEAIRNSSTPIDVKRKLWENDPRRYEYFPDLHALGNSSDDMQVRKHIHLMQDYLNEEYYEAGFTSLYWVYESTLEYYDMDWDLGIWNSMVLHFISKNIRNNVTYYGSD